jgi:hypothetical protein
MQAKPGKESQREIPPPDTASSPPPVYRGTAPGFDFYLQSNFEIQKSIGGLESSIKHLSEREQAHEAKLEAISGEVHDLAKEMHGAKRIAWVFGAIGSIIGAIGLVFLNKILDVVVSYYTAHPPAH